MSEFKLVSEPFLDSDQAAAWLCWLINLGLVEIYLFFGSNTLLPRTGNEEMDQMARSGEFRRRRGL
jgi:hypothetical protein